VSQALIRAIRLYRDVGYSLVS